MNARNPYQDGWPFAGTGKKYCTDINANTQTCTDFYTTNNDKFVFCAPDGHSGAPNNKCDKYEQELDCPATCEMITVRGQAPAASDAPVAHR